MRRRVDAQKRGAPAGSRAEVVRELEVTALGAGGVGVARDEGRVVLVAGAVPGDRVLARLAPGGIARVLRVLHPGPDRVTPPCAHAAGCGGCDWMHLAAPARRAAHQRLAVEAIAHALGVAPADLPAAGMHLAERELGYRTRARFTVRAEPRAVRVGFRAPGSRDLVAIDRCIVLDDRLADLAPRLAALLAGARGDGDATIALGRTADGRAAPVLDLAFRGDLAPGTFGGLDALVRDGTWAGARVTLEGVSAPATFGDPRPVLAGADGAPLVVAEGGFSQPSDEGGVALARRVAELADVAEQHVVELFAGSGTLSILLARGAASFLGVEQVEPAVRAARENFAARGLSGKFVVADAESHPVPPRADVVVLDPPRTGARAAVRAIAAARPRRVVYVSCDVATLARDLAVLCGGPGAGQGAAPARSGPFVVDSIDLFELFPQTSHVESVVRLVRAPRARAS